MKNFVRLSTQTRNILLCVLSLLGIGFSFSYDVTNLIVGDVPKEIWWNARMTVLKCGYIMFLFALKTFEGRPKLNVLLNVGILIIFSDIIGRLNGDIDRDFWDFIWVVLTILFCIYEYRKRRVST